MTFIYRHFILCHDLGLCDFYAKYSCISLGAMYNSRPLVLTNSVLVIAKLRL